jgi:phenylalanyl-tRNA synthetase beta chain
MVRHLEALGATCAPAGDGTVAVTPPSWRFDLEREIDLIEEVVRLEGYQEVAEATSARVLLGQRSNPRRELAGRARRAAINLGFRQVMSYSMVSPALLERTLPGRPALRIRNPLAEELSVLRTSLLPSLVATAVHNLNRRAESLRLFELDREFHPDPESGTGCRESQHLALLLCGDRRLAGWQGPAEPFTFHDLRESVLALLKSLHLEGLRFLPYLGDVFSANSLALSCQGQALGVFGQLDPLICEGLGTERPVFALDLDLEESRAFGPSPGSLPSCATSIWSARPECRRESWPRRCWRRASPCCATCRCRTFTRGRACRRAASAAPSACASTTRSAA